MPVKARELTAGKTMDRDTGNAIERITGKAVALKSEQI
jgi:hypothetical protein